MPSSDTQFKKGNKGPGRPKGSRNKITKKYLDDLVASYAEHGKEMIEKVRVDEPVVYLRLIAALVPKDLDIKHSGDVTVQIVNYGDIDEQADSERIASNGSVPISLVE